MDAHVDWPRGEARPREPSWRFNVFATRGSGPNGQTRGATSHLSFSFGRPLPHAEPTKALQWGDVPNVRLHFEKLPGVGQRFGNEFFPGSPEVAFRVEPGSQLATLPYWNGGLTGGFSGVLRVDGDPDKVFAAYVRQAAGLVSGLSLRDERETRYGNVVSRVVSGGGAGGLDITITLTTQPGRSTWLYIAVGND